MKKLNLTPQKIEFLKLLVAERIEDGRFGLDEILYLDKNQEKFGLNESDIYIFAQQVYKETFNLAMEDGILSKEESIELQKIKDLIVSNAPANKPNLEFLKNNIAFLRNTLKNKIEHHTEPEIEKLFKQVLKLVPKF